MPANRSVQRAGAAEEGTGTIKGRIVDENGAAADATVYLHGVGQYYEAHAYTWDLGDGRYELKDVPPGQYKVSIYDNARGTQWVPQKEHQDDATIFTLADGGTLVVDEQWLPLGSVEVRVTNADTGQPVAEPCVYIHSTPQSRSVCGANGLVRVDGVPPGYWQLSVGAGASYFPTAEGEASVDVVRSQVTRVSYQLDPAAAVTTTVVDAQTGAPIGGICVHEVRPEFGGQSAHMGLTCSDDDGRLEIGPYGSPFTFQLYAWQARNPYTTPPKLYGAQWVTGDGGSGDQRAALTVTLRTKQTIAIPPIRMDPPGAISGIVRNQAGAPVPSVCAYPYAFNSNQGGTFGKHCSNAEGRYTIPDLGPYRWPVEFTSGSSSGYAWQWSGDVADRFSATYTKVTPGGTASVDARLTAGGLLSGTITRGGSAVDGGYVWTYNARTGDIASASFAVVARDGTFTVKGHRSQQVLVEYWSGTKGCWYGTTRIGLRLLASRVTVTAGATTTVAMDMAKTCGVRPGRPLPPRRTLDATP